MWQPEILNESLVMDFLANDFSLYGSLFNKTGYQPSITRQMAEENKSKAAQNQINIELTEEIAEGIYSNLAMIAHSNSEFVIDFIRLMPGVPKAKVKSRIVITPEHAKRFLAALKDNIEKYEASFGPIKRTEDMPKFPMNFGGTMGEA